MKRKSTKQSKSAQGRGRTAGKSRGGMKMGARSSSRSTVRASGGKSSAKSGSRSKTRGSKSRNGVSAKSNPRLSSRAASNSRGSVSAKSKSRVTSRAKSSSVRKPQTGARAGRAISKAVTNLRGRNALKSTSELRAKRGETRARSGGISQARPARVKQPLGTNRPVNASTKPSVGKLPISNIQHSAVDERLSPQSDKPYTGADAFKPDAKGADTLMSAPPRKPIRQSRNQVGVRHH